MWRMDVVTGIWMLSPWFVVWWEGLGLVGGSTSLKVDPESLKTSANPCSFSLPGVSG